MTDYKAKAILLLAKGLQGDFQDFVAEDDSFQELLHKLADEFVADNVSILDKDSQSDLAAELVLSLSLSSQ